MLDAKNFGLPSSLSKVMHERVHHLPDAVHVGRMDIVPGVLKVFRLCIKTHEIIILLASEPTYSGYIGDIAPCPSIHLSSDPCLLPFLQGPPGT
jgi:hypothetical protein